VIVELGAHRQFLVYRLVEGRHEEPAHAHICHDSAVTASPAAAILAGGAARRFGGGDKSRLIVDGLPIIVRQIAVLQAIAEPVYVAGGDPARFTDLGLPVYPDVVRGAGAIGGILTALAHAPADRVIVVACDLPFLSGPLLRRLAELAGEGDGAWVRGVRGVEPLVAVYRRTATDRVRAAIERGQLKAGDLGLVLRMVEMPLDVVAGFGAPERLLANVNTPGEYAQVQ
jgi:molybdopterin-guanine dinucleotide biosynthesis protein A